MDDTMLNAIREHVKDLQRTIRAGEDPGHSFAAEHLCVAFGVSRDDVYSYCWALEDEGLLIEDRDGGFIVVGSDLREANLR